MHTLYLFTVFFPNQCVYLNVMIKVSFPSLEQNFKLDASH